MSKNEFDELLLKKLQEEELEYDPKHWDHLSQLLPPSLAPAANRGKKWAIATGIAAAAAFVLAAVFYMKLADKNNDPVQAPALAREQGPQQPTVAPQALSRPASAIEQQNTSQAQEQPANQHPSPVLTGNSSSQTPALPPQVMPQQAPPAQAHMPVPAVPPVQAPAEEHIAKAQEQPTATQAAPEVRKEHQEAPILAKNDTRKSTFPVYPADNFDNPRTAYNSGAKANRTSISLGGGVNYGNLNTGYTVGIGARTKIAGNFFVDGTVAMMYNNNTTNVVNYNGAATMSKGMARPSASQLPASPAVEPIQNLYYVQVNPSIGYQIDKNVALSVGSDFQQMLSRTDGAEKVQLAADNARIFPAFDVGLTTKSEFNITPNIQAGLMYREGLSNLLKNDGNRYVNRRYFQVQFKYNIPVN